MEKGNWVTPDGKRHPGVFYGVGVADGNKHMDIPDLPAGQLYGHWESEGETSEAPKWGREE